MPDLTTHELQVENNALMRELIAYFQGERAALQDARADLPGLITKRIYVDVAKLTNGVGTLADPMNDLDAISFATRISPSSVGTRSRARPPCGRSRWPTRRKQTPQMSRGSPGGG